MGLTQATLANLSGLSRATVIQVEQGTINDLSLTRAARLLEVLGMTLAVGEAGTRRALARAYHALEVAARIASVSYREALTAGELRGILTNHEPVPARRLPHVRTLLDEAPVSILAAVVSELEVREGIARTATWARMRDLARELKTTRELWQ